MTLFPEIDTEKPKASAKAGIGFENVFCAILQIPSIVPSAASHVVESKR